MTFAPLQMLPVNVGDMYFLRSCGEYIVQCAKLVCSKRDNALRQLGVSISVFASP